MEMFETGYFDFILFSHNGIDYVDHDDRLKILKEIRRIGKSGGYFCFSTHNLNSLANLFEWRRAVSLNPKLAVRTAKRLALRFFCNRGVSAGKVRTSPYVLINDGAHHRQLLTHYIKPLEQIAQLENDFTDIRVFSLASGAEIKDRTQLNTNEDVWLYYLCRIR
jgi:SAM-dependent methyltransferase